MANINYHKLGYKDGYHLDDNHDLVQIRNGKGFEFHPAKKAFVPAKGMLTNLSAPITVREAAAVKRKQVSWYERCLKEAKSLGRI